MKKEAKQMFERFYLTLKKHVKSNNEKFKSPAQYCYYLQLAVADLGIDPSVFSTVTQPGLLKAMLKKLVEAKPFVARDQHLQKDIISGFKKYIHVRPSF